jgi:hypothetical protein
VNEIGTRFCLLRFRAIRPLANPFELACAKFMCSLGFSAEEIASEIEVCYSSEFFNRLREKLAAKIGRPLSDDEWERALTNAQAGKTIDEISADLTVQRPRTTNGPGI